MLKLRILVADESEFIRQEVRGALSNQPNIQMVAEAASSTELLAKLAETKPQVVILDTALPSMGGANILHKIRELQPDIKPIVLTTSEREELIGASMEAGAYGYVMKFDVRRKLVAAVHAACSGLRFFDRRVLEIVLRGYLKGSAGKIEVPWIQISLTAREFEIIRFLARGYGNREVAANLGIKVRTVETHRKNIMRKLNLRTLAELIHYAIASGIIRIDSHSTSTGSPHFPNAFVGEGRFETGSYK